MRTLARVATVLTLGLAPLAASAPASASEIIDACYYHDIEVRVRPYVCVGVNYPWLPPTGG